jgi:hypothetical protein
LFFTINFKFKEKELLLQQLKQQSVSKRMIRKNAAASATLRKITQDNTQIKYNEKSKENKIYCKFSF